MSIASRITSIEGHISDIYDSVELTGVDTTDIDKNLVNVPNTLKEGYIDIINNGTDTLYNNFPKVSGEGTSLTLNNTYQAPMRNNLKGNTSQTGTPTPTSPIPVNVVSGDNEVQVWGKNILNTLYQHNAGDVVTSNGITFTFNQDGSIKLSGTATSNAFVMLYGEISQFSTTLFKLPNTFKASGGITYPIGILGRVTGSGTYQELRTATGGTEYGCVFLQVIGGQSVNTTIYPQIEKGSQATNYEPYQGNTYNIDLPSGMELCKIGTYQDYIYKDSDKWYLYKAIGKVVLNGSETWNNQYTNGWNTNIENIKQTTSGNDNSYVISNYYQVGSQNAVFSSNYGICNRANQYQIILKNKDLADTTALINWLSTHNTIVYYVLSTPTNTEITDTTLINQLEELYIAKSKENQTNISQINNDLGFIINASALKKG